MLDSASPPQSLLDTGNCTYNLGDGEGFSVRDVIDAGQRVTGVEIPTAVGPRRAGDPAWLVASSQRIRDELGWRTAKANLDESSTVPGAGISSIPSDTSTDLLWLITSLL